MSNHEITGITDEARQNINRQLAFLYERIDNSDEGLSPLNVEELNTIQNKIKELQQALAKLN